ncbi:hypothetical protein LCGC14_2134280 [marine sediment metagenome]|uniref:Uncharacterized protein n=1 Tax=marine sediment metagenome TaxID=412755 RepID=A0A0F9GWK9_9ZZZZ
MVERIETRVSIEKSFVPNFWIWSGKRADGEDREPFVPFTVGDFVVSKYLGLQFVSDKHCALRFHGLVLSGIATKTDEIDIPLKLVKFEVAIVVVGNTNPSLAGKYELAGWVTAKELRSVGQKSHDFGMDGRRYFIRDLRPISELNHAIASGKIDIDLEEADEWWHK